MRLAVLMFLWILLSPAIAYPQNGKIPPAAGRFLVATPNLPDPRFSEAVILLFHADKKGAAGLILNHPTTIAVAKAFPHIINVQKQKDLLFIGGPVSGTSIFLLLQGPDPGENAQRVFGDVYVTSNKEIIEKTASNLREPKGARFFAGYAGWSAGQLEMEISGNHWNVMPAETGIIFHPSPAQVWKEIIDRSYLLITSRPFTFSEVQKSKH